MSAMNRVFGSFRILRRRAREVGQPGLGIWADAGERAATAVRNTIRDEAHAAECAELEAARLLENALADGIDKRDTDRIRRALRHIKHAAGHDHTLGGVAS